MINQLKSYRNGVHGEFFLSVAADLERLQKLADTRLEKIKAMSSFLDDVATALGVAKPGTPVEGIGACWNVMGKIAELQDNMARLLAPEWRDAGTPPKIIGAGRSNHVLGAIPFDRGHLMRVCYYTIADGWIDARSLAIMSPIPTHWQPLPEPPSAESV